MSMPWDEDTLRAKYAPRLGDTTLRHGPGCPSPEALLAAVRGDGDSAVRRSVLDQALRCPACQREMALLHAVSGVSARTQSIAPRRLTWQRLVPLAAAASIVIAVGLFGVDRMRERAAGEITRAGAEGDPALIAPANGSAPSASAVTFVWHPVERALRYTLEVNAADGTVLYTSSVGDTVLTARLASVGAGEHRWWVRAHLDDGSERRSVAWILRVP